MKKKKNYFNFLKSERKLFYVSKVKTNRPAFTNIPDFWISAQRTFKKAKSMFQGRKIHVEEAVLSYTPSPVTCHNSLTTFSSSLSPLFHSLSLSLLSSSFFVSCAHLIIKDSEYRYEVPTMIFCFIYLPFFAHHLHLILASLYREF